MLDVLSQIMSKNEKDAEKLVALSELENEKAGKGDYSEVIAEEESELTYIEAVNEELEKIKIIKKKGGLCHDEFGSPRSSNEMHQAFEEKMMVISKNILRRLDSFLWTLSSDGRDHQKDNPCGCSNAEVLTKHKTKRTKVRGEICSAGRNHDFNQKRYSMELGH